MSESSETPEQRMAKLSAALSDLHDRSWQRLMNADWFAQSLALNLSRYIGIPSKPDEIHIENDLIPVTFLSYKAAHSPDYDEYTPQDSAMDALRVDAEGFYTFGLRLQLQMGPIVRPRYSFHFYVRVKIDESDWKCQVGIGKQQIIRLGPKPDIDSLRPVIENIYRDLLIWLESSAKGVAVEGRIGFVKG